VIFEPFTILHEPPPIVAFCEAEHIVLRQPPLILEFGEEICIVFLYPPLIVDALAQEMWQEPPRTALFISVALLPKPDNTAE
jgi:hypothetical protein